MSAGMIEVYMKSRRNFKVINPPILFWLCICIRVFFVFLVLLNTIFSPPPHITMYVCITILVFIPGIIVVLWTKTFRIKVNGTQISVRKCFGLDNFSLDVSEIAKVKWKVVDKKFGQNEKVTVFTSKGKRIPIETLMVNSDKMMKLIKENVEETKIKRIYKTLK